MSDLHASFDRMHLGHERMGQHGQQGVRKVSLHVPVEEGRGLELERELGPNGAGGLSSFPLEFSCSLRPILEVQEERGELDGDQLGARCDGTSLSA